MRNEHERCYRVISSDESLALDLDLFVRNWEPRRIRFLRRRTQKFVVNAGSRTTQRVKGEAGNLSRRHSSLPSMLGRIPKLTWVSRTDTLQQRNGKAAATLP